MWKNVAAAAFLVVVGASGCIGGASWLVGVWLGVCCIGGAVGSLACGLGVWWARLGLGIVGWVDRNAHLCGHGSGNGSWQKLMG